MGHVDELADSDFGDGDRSRDLSDHVAQHLRLLSMDDRDTDNAETLRDLAQLQDRKELLDDIFTLASDHPLAIGSLFLAYNEVLKHSSGGQDAVVIAQLRRICAQPGRSWDEKCDSLRHHYEQALASSREHRERHILDLYRAQALKLRRENLLKDAFLRLRETATYTRKLRGIAKRQEAEFIVRRVAQKIRFVNEEVLRLQSTSLGFRHYSLRQRVLVDWANKARTRVLLNDRADRQLRLSLMDRTLGWWLTKTRMVSDNLEQAEQWDEVRLLSKHLFRTTTEASVSKLRAQKHDTVRKKVFTAWRWNAAQASVDYHNGLLHYNKVCRKRHWDKLISAKTELEKHVSSADRFHGENVLPKFFGAWKTATDVSVQKNQLLAKHLQNVALDIFNTWREALLLKMEAKRFRKHSLLHSGVKTLTLGLKTRLFRKKTASDLTARITTMWRFKSRARLTSRVNNGVMAESILSHWRKITADREHNRTVRFRKLSLELEKRKTRRFLHIWRDHLEDVAEEVNQADCFRRKKLLTQGVAKLGGSIGQIAVNYNKADAAYDKSVARRVLHSWLEKMTHQRETRLEEKVAVFHAVQNEESMKRALSRWVSASVKVSEDLAVAEDLFIEKDLLTMKEIFDYWLDLARNTRGLVEDAAQIDSKRVLNATFSSWLFKTQRVEYFDNAAAEMRTKFLRKTQRQSVRKWRLRTLRMMQNQRTATDFEERRNSRLAGPYFKKWLDKHRSSKEGGPFLSDEAVSYHEIRELHGFETPLRSSRRPPASIRLSRLRQDPSTPRKLLAPLLKKQLDETNQYTI